MSDLPSKPSKPSDDDLIAAAMAQAMKAPADDTPGLRGSGSSAEAQLELQPSLFPGYTVIKELHRGGQGVVYQAVQHSTKRKVAIKVMREGPFASSKDKARFDREIEVLSSLNHPNIVAIHDSGEAGGLHFFVMDYISGQSLEAYLRSSKLDPRKVVQMFVKICDAVNAAHLKGIIHRDLKPGNIRVDQRGEPHILDFGLAKTSSALEGGGSLDVMTATGQFIGSLPWASPEQAEGSVAKIDVRTDVYSLGVMLYQALTGRFPYDVLGNMRDALDNILRAEPVRPSTVGRRLDNDVETIVLKCLSKERDRRYQSAGDLARDLQRYLVSEPIEAKRDSGLYVLQKLISRNKPSAIAAAVVALAVVGTAVVSTVAWRETARQRNAAVTAQQRADVAAAEATTFSDFMESTLTSLHPTYAQGRDPALMEAVLSDAVTRASSDLADRPVLASRVFDLVGRTCLSIGQAVRGDEYISRALAMREKEGPPDALVRSLMSKAQSLMAIGPDRAREALTVAERAATLAPPGSETQAEATYLMGLANRRMNQLAKAREHYAAAQSIYDALPPREGRAGLMRAEMLASMTRFFVDAGELSEAVETGRRAAKAAEAAAGVRSIEAAVAKNNLGLALRARNAAGDAEEAARVYAEVVATYERLLPEDHLSRAVARNNLGWTALALNKPTEAKEHLETALKVIRAWGSPAPRRTADQKIYFDATFNMGDTILAGGDAPAAEQTFRECLRIAGESRDPAKDQWAAQARSGVGRALEAQGKPDRAEPEFVGFYEGLRAALGETHARVKRAAKEVAGFYDRWGKKDVADRYRALGRE